MLRLIGVFMILGGCFAGTKLLNQTDEKRIADMYQLIEIMEYMRIEITEERKILPEIFLSLSQRLPEDYAKVFRECVEQKGTEEDTHLAVLYQEKMRKLLMERNICQEAWNAVTGIICAEELTLGESMTGRIVRGKEHLLRLIQAEEKEYWRKKKLVTRMGLLSGGIFVLIFI